MRCCVMVKSFQLDHLNMPAPNIRVSDTIELGDNKIVKYDIRFKKPYIDKVLEGATMHTIEHLIATTLRQVSKCKIVDFSPMGCKTGFYLTVINPSDSFVKEDIKAAMQDALTFDVIPGNAKESCGNFEYHNLADAKLQLQSFIDKAFE